MLIRYGVSSTPLGECVIAATPHGICRMEFVVNRKTSELRVAQAALAAGWPTATLVEDREAMAALAEQAFAGFHPPGQSNTARFKPPPLHVRGTNFQVNIWRALLEVPAGKTTTYGALAAAAGFPGAFRATGRAVGANPVAWLIPCHRVLQSDGSLGGYRWGKTRKAGALMLEANRH